jgi:lipopolysaccharide export system ATP-binding protein
MLKEIIINLQRERPEMSIVICEHQARELLSIVDKAMILSDCKIIAQGSPHELLNNQKARNSYFGEAFKR